FWSKTFYQDTSGVIWIGTVGRGLFRKKGEEIQNFNFDNGLLTGNIVTSILDYNEELLWISTDGGGITILNKNTLKTEFVIAEHEDPFSLSVNNITNLFKDRQNGIWVGTYGEGLNKYDPNKFLFHKMALIPHRKNGLNNDKILSLFQDSSEEIWVGTDGGGVNRKLDEFTFKHYTTTSKNGQSISGNVILNIDEDKHGNIWIATFGGGISIYNKHNNKITVHNSNTNEGLKYNVIWDIVKDNDGTMWVGLEEGNVARYNESTNTYEYVLNNSPNKEQLFSRSLFEDSQGRLWCSFLDNGLWIIDKKTMIIEKVDLGDLNFFSINQLYEDSEGTIWMASERYGLVKLIFEGDDISYEKIQFVENHASYLSLRGIEEDEEKNLWVSTDIGIFRYNLLTEKTDHFTIENGLQANQFSFGTCFKSNDGIIYFGGKNGYTFFKPSEITSSQSAQNIELTAITLFDIPLKVSEEGVLKSSFSETKNLILDHNQNTIGFQFSELNFSNKSEKKFCYILEGFDQQWFNNRTETTVRYTNLPPGIYTFIVQPMENNQCVEGKQTSLTITILFPWWEQLWFRIVTVVFALLIIYILFYIRFRLIKRRNQYLENTVKERTNELVEINEQLKDNNEKLIKAQNQLITSEKMASLGSLMAGIAHEINNPMNFIKGGMNVLDEGHEELEKFITGIESEKTGGVQKTVEMMKKVSKNINNGINRIISIVEGLRIFTRSGVDQMEFVDIHQNINATLIILEHSYKEKIELLKNFGDLPEIKCHPGKLNQVFSNIITNGIQAIDAKKETTSTGKIVIMTEHDPENKSVILSFADNGDGIADEVKNTLFDPFVTTKPQGVGTGLGLSLTYSIIEEHKGTITYSREKIKGIEPEEEFTIFKIVLPIQNFSANK
ncbi:MAG: ATP-binding protein, partial [Cyclobacteriaceae bacterium]|nr:ATP-binding protein [Cyclobacteriaceae bacterium]